MSALDRMSVHRRKFILSATMLAASAAIPSKAEAAYPSRPVRFIVPSAPGSGTDILARILGGKLSQQWGQPVIVENRDGVAGVTGTDYVARASPDGYTLCMSFTGPLAASPALLKSVPYNPVKDFATVTLVDSSPAVLVINPSLPANSVKELIALAKAEPGVLNFGSAGYGTIGHMSGELFRVMSGTNIVHVPYKSVAQAVTDVIGGQIKVLFHVAPAVMPLVKAGQLRGLGVTSLKPWSLVPELPAIAEAGLPGFQSTVWHGVVVPTGTPPSIVDKLYKDIASVMRTDDVRQKFAAQWIEPLGTSPEEFAQFLKAEVENNAKLVKEAGLIMQ
jgi:tripartite-type tricarboxylate transporter receptor subunit TctC